MGYKSAYTSLWLVKIGDSEIRIAANDDPRDALDKALRVLDKAPGETVKVSLRWVDYV